MADLELEVTAQLDRMVMLDLLVEHYGKEQELMKKSLEDSNIPEEHHGFIKCLCRQMMAVAIEHYLEKEEITNPI